MLACDARRFACCLRTCLDVTDAVIAAIVSELESAVKIESSFSIVNIIVGVLCERLWELPTIFALRANGRFLCVHSTAVYILRARDLWASLISVLFVEDGRVLNELLLAAKQDFASAEIKCLR